MTIAPPDEIFDAEVFESIPLTTSGTYSVNDDSDKDDKNSSFLLDSLMELDIDSFSTKIKSRELIDDSA